MDSIITFTDLHSVAPPSPSMAAVHHCNVPCTLSYGIFPFRRTSCSRFAHRRVQSLERLPGLRLPAPLPSIANGTTNSTPHRDVACAVGDFMTRKEDLHIVKTTTTVDEALEILLEKRCTGFPVVNDDWNLVGVVSDYDLLALDSISGGGRADTSVFPDVDSSWKTFNEIQKLVGKTKGKVVGDLMTPAPLVICESTNLEDTVRLLLETKYHRLPVVDAAGKLVGMITRENVVRASVQAKRAIEKY